MNQLKATEEIRTIGMHVCPQLQWDDQLKVMKERMIDSIAKFNNTEIKLHLINVHFNACFLKKMFFGCGVINLKDRQYKELRKLHETKIAKKLRLGSNFPRVALHSRKNAVEIGLINRKKLQQHYLAKFSSEILDQKRR